MPAHRLLIPASSPEARDRLTAQERDVLDIINSLTEKGFLGQLASLQVYEAEPKEQFDPLDDH